jgi:hypothetical protein
MEDTVRGGEGRGIERESSGSLYPTNSTVGGRTRGGASARNSCNLAPNFEGETNGEMEQRGWFAEGADAGTLGVREGVGRGHGSVRFRPPEKEGGGWR